MEINWQGLSEKELDARAKAEPWAALQYAADHLTPERLDKCRSASAIK